MCLSFFSFSLFWRTNRSHWIIFFLSSDWIKRSTDILYKHKSIQILLLTLEWIQTVSGLQKNFISLFFFSLHSTWIENLEREREKESEKKNRIKGWTNASQSFFSCVCDDTFNSFLLIHNEKSNRHFKSNQQFFFILIILNENNKS